MQESLFDNPRFQFVADTLRRVKDRFEQVRIAREDVAFVVAERLLKKDAKQQALIREHLQQFAPLYGSMNERMEEFVRLFPVHPAYLDTFERVYVAEKREVLKTLSAAMRRLIDQDVPARRARTDRLRLLLGVLRGQPVVPSRSRESRRSSTESEVLEGRIQQAFTRPQYKPAALRIVHALSVHRLTTADIYAPIGATAEELRDDLCLILPVPEQDAELPQDARRDGAEGDPQDGERPVPQLQQGQRPVLPRPEEGCRFRLAHREEGRGPRRRAARSLLLRRARRVVLEDPDAAPYVTGYRIWEHEVEWRERKAGRSGYLFFGAPNERSTAQPHAISISISCSRSSRPTSRTRRKLTRSSSS